MRTVYLDTCVLSRIVDARIKEKPAAAYAEIVKKRDVQLVTSDKTHAEVLKTTSPVRNSLLQFLVALVERVPLRVVEFSGALGGAPLGVMYLGGAITDPLLGELRQIFDPDDATHIAHAVRAGCNYFLTLDDATILSRARSNAERVKVLCESLEFVDPEKLAERLS